MQWLASFYEGMRKQAGGRDVSLPPFEAFWAANDYVRFPVPEENRHWVRFADYREDPLMNPLGTPSGKIEIYSATIAAMQYDDCP